MIHSIFQDRLLYNLLLCDPFLNVLLHGFVVREFELPCDAVHGPLGLRVEHGVGIVLVLHSNVENLVVASLGPQYILVHPGRVQDIPGLQPEALFKERKVEVVAGAQNDGVYIGSATILEVDSFAVDLCEQWSLSDLRGPLEAHWPGLVGANDLLGAIFEVLQSDILSGIAGADNEERLALELIGISEVVRVHHATRKLLYSWKRGNVRHREVTSRYNKVVKLLNRKVFVLDKAFDNH